MLDVWDALDLASNDQQIEQAKQRYISGEIDVERLEEEIGDRLSELVHWDREHNCPEYLARMIEDDIERMARQRNAERAKDHQDHLSASA